MTKRKSRSASARSRQRRPAGQRQPSVSRPASAANQAPKQSARPSDRPTIQRPSKAVAQQAPAAQTVNFAEEYRYVVSDLKRFAILAVAMFATLIVLALVLT